ncbi:DUF4184 family protein [Pontibacter akesuensis]|uniref:DUF4184 family protein n=1 Tax=Pontibacter akesuensis TaxID=388950 RepID=A0A1I7FHJ7_9BACT|nr:DUF4184 family protein [Pontibacter akesuensis]GHA62145.1 hypothetical protein GCM10007389_13530 [Pontibacter akesuensis]SFU35647.1 protein of unknown function [Pontibacter akesuensis]
MPFTFSHPAIVLPLKKLKPNWFSVNGLVLGSMAPDLQYFLKMSGASDFGHTAIGVFAIDLPLSFLVAIAFHRWVRNSLIRHLPSPLDTRYSDFLTFDFNAYLRRSWFVFAASAFVGALSHMFWDFFGRPEGIVYYFAPAFFEQTLQLGPVEMEVNDLIERIGSVLGLIFLGWLVFQKKEPIAPAVASRTTRQKFTFWGAVLLGTLLITALKLWLDWEEDSAGFYIIVLISAGSWSFVLASVLYHFFSRQPNASSRTS